MTTSRCRGCGRLVQWRLTPANKRMFLDAAPTQETTRGVYALTGAYQCEPYDPDVHAGQPRYMNHWATCPERERFRKAKATQ